VIGVELGGALKNVVALAAGVSDGLGFGYNTRAALITRGLAEMTRMGAALGANPGTFSGLAGMGDLVLTCTGDLSRNRTVGMELGRGRTLEDILRNMNMVAEGVKTTLSAYQLAQKIGVEVPITEQMYRILYQNKDPRQAVSDLMLRELKAEAF
jgi:glycerol-3-phosphate dehydrogenase (NAD(P)+)